jgi:hypothetical protein
MKKKHSQLHARKCHTSFYRLPPFGLYMAQDSQDFAEFCSILSILPSPALPLLRHREAIVCCLLARRWIPIRPRPASSSSGLAQAFCALQHQHSDGDEELDSMVPEPRVDLQHQARRFGRQRAILRACLAPDLEVNLEGVLQGCLGRAIGTGTVSCSNSRSLPYFS